MSNLDQVLQEIIRVATSPAMVSDEVGSVQQQPIDGLLKLLRYLEAQKAAGQPEKALTLRKMIPRGDWHV